MDDFIEQLVIAAMRRQILEDGHTVPQALHAQTLERAADLFTMPTRIYLSKGYDKVKP
jgi:hypothetical protein